MFNERPLTPCYNPDIAEACPFESDIRCANDENDGVFLVLIDLGAAFVTLDYDILVLW